MNIENLDENLKFLAQPYPGRMVLVGLDETGLNWRLFSSIGGRSEGSKNRIYEQVGVFVQTAVFDDTKQKGDASKTLYIAQTHVGSYHVVSNGHQGIAIAGTLYTGHSFVETQEEWENEGKDADYTARITGVINLAEERALLGTITRNPLEHAKSVYTVHRLDIPAGYGFFILTYNGDGGTMPFTSHPMPIRLHGSLEDNMEMLWSNFNHATRVALVGKEINRGSGRLRYVLKNANLGD